MSNHYVVEVETTTPAPAAGQLDAVDVWVDRIEPWHGSISANAGHLLITLTLPAENLTQAVVTALAVIGQWVEPLGVNALPEQVRDARDGWTPVPELLSVADAAEALQVSRQRVLQMIGEGKLPGTKVGRSYSVPRSAVEALASR